MLSNKSKKKKKKNEWHEKTRVTLEAAATPLGQRLRRTNGGSVSRIRAGSGVGQGYKKTSGEGRRPVGFDPSSDRVLFGVGVSRTQSTL